jgi:hypothetical protein
MEKMERSDCGGDVLTPDDFPKNLRKLLNQFFRASRILLQRSRPKRMWITCDVVQDDSDQELSGR